MDKEFVVISLDKYNDLYQANQILNDIYVIFSNNLGISCIGHPSLDIDGEEKLMELIINKNPYLERKIAIMTEEQKNGW